MFFHKFHVLFFVAAVMATMNIRRAGWLDRIVSYQKALFFKDLQKHTPVKISAELRPTPPGYVDSTQWDYDTVIRLLTLIRQNEGTKKLHKQLRRMLQPSRRLMMSMSDSMKKFPSLVNRETNAFYYSIEYTSDEEEIPPPPTVPEDEVVLVVANPVEARLPSARISVKLLREILEARARAGRSMPTTIPSTISWKPMNVTPTPRAPTSGGDGGGDGGGGDDDNDSNSTSSDGGGGGNDTSSADPGAEEPGETTAAAA